MAVGGVAEMSGVSPRAAGAWSETAAPHGGKRDEGWGIWVGALCVNCPLGRVPAGGGYFCFFSPAFPMACRGVSMIGKLLFGGGGFSWRRMWAAACT